MMLLPDASVVETHIPVEHIPAVEADATMGPPIVAPVRVTVYDPGIKLPALPTKMLALLEVEDTDPKTFGVAYCTAMELPER
jgi:hypothetical protein